MGYKKYCNNDSLIFDSYMWIGDKNVKCYKYYKYNDSVYKYATKTYTWRVVGTSYFWGYSGSDDTWNCSVCSDCGRGYSATKSLYKNATCEINGKDVWYR